MARGNKPMRVAPDFFQLVKEISRDTKQTCAEITKDISAKIRKA